MSKVKRYWLKLTWIILAVQFSGAGTSVIGAGMTSEGNSHFSENARVSGVSQKEEKELSMLTCNIWFDSRDWPARFAILLREIRELDPDIIGLQEVIQRENLDNQAKMMADSLGYHYHFTSVDPDTADKRFGNAILSRFPLEETNEQALKPYNDYRTAVHVKIKAGGEMIDVYNTHLHHIVENHEIREEQISGLLDFIDETSGEGPVFLMGDFNANPDWPETSLLHEDFRDVYPIFNDNHLDSVHSTLNFHLGHDKRRIDHIYFNRDQSQRIIPLKAEIVLNEEGENGVYPSDHFGVYAEFRIGLDAEEPEYTQVFFENSLMEESWFYSNAGYEGSSYIFNIRGRLPVSHDHAFTPGNSLKLHYRSAPEGNWTARLNFPGWRGKDHLKESQQLSMWIHTGSKTSTSELPEVAVESDDGAISKFVPLGKYLDEPLGEEWLQVTVPLTEFSDDVIKYEHSQEIVSLIFRQASDDDKEHLVHLDQVELLPEGTDPAELPEAPELKSAKGYERHVDLVWESVDPSQVRYVKIYRSTDGSEFEPVSVQNAEYMFRHTDFTGTPGETFEYRISVLNHEYRESDLSEPIKAETRMMNDEELLDMVQEASFRYYWDAAEPNSGLARENIPGRKNMIATGASGFGIMALIVGAERGFIEHEALVNRLEKIVTFLEDGDRFHGAFAHFMDGPTGRVEPFFGRYDDGGDLVETSFLMQGLLTVRQYLSEEDNREKRIKKRITGLWETVEWDWYRRYDDSPYLYWHWSPDHEWHINHKLIGWNETMITYMLAMASPAHSIPAEMYYTGWASQDSIAQAYRINWGQTSEGFMYVNDNTYHGVDLDVGVSNGGPLFFTHYSYMGMNPQKVEDGYTNYFKNNRNIARINFRYCCENPNGFPGYGKGVWGLTASDGPRGYKAREPVPYMDNGTIAPTGALSSYPYLPDEAMEALKTYYREYGKFLWGPYGFRDAFNLSEDWVANIYMGLNQAPMAVMIENHRSGLIWDLFMSNPEIGTALENMQKIRGDVSIK